MITAYRLFWPFCLLCRPSPWWSPSIIGQGPRRRHGWTDHVCPSCWSGWILVASSFSYIGLSDDTNLIHRICETFLMNLGWQSLLSLFLRFKSSRPVCDTLHSVKIRLNLMHGLIKKRLWRSSLLTEFRHPSGAYTVATRCLGSWRIQGSSHRGISPFRYSTWSFCVYLKCSLLRTTFPCIFASFTISRTSGICVQGASGFALCCLSCQRLLTSSGLSSNVPFPLSYILWFLPWFYFFKMSWFFLYVL